MRTLKIFIYAVVINCVYWLLPFYIYNENILDNSLGYDSYRYIAAAVMLVRGEGIHLELINNPLPVLWTYLWLHSNYLTLIVVQSLIYAMAAAPLLRTTVKLSIPSWLMLVSICNPVLVTYIGAPSKEFFVLVSTMLTLGWLLKGKGEHGASETVVMLIANCVAAAVRPVNLLFLVTMILAFRLPKRRPALASALILILFLMPKGNDYYAGAEMQNDFNPSSSAIMEAFREMCAKPGILVQLIMSPLRMVFYIIYPTPNLNIFRFLDKTNDLEGLTYNYRSSVEAIGFMVYAASALAVLNFRRRRFLMPQNVSLAVNNMCSYYMLSLACLAVVSPFPVARYRVVALFGLPFMFWIGADKFVRFSHTLYKPIVIDHDH